MKRLCFTLVAIFVLTSSAYAIWPFSRPTYTLTVINGSGSGSYKAGAVIPIVATPQDGATFTAWLSSTDAITWGQRPTDFADPNAAMTVVTMPKSNLTVQATYLLPHQP